MGFRFRKSIRIIPGVRLNISKTGVSTSVGGRGATANISKKGVRGTVGLPGSGMSYSTMLTRSRGRAGRSQSSGSRSGGRAVLWIIAILMLLAMFHH